MVAAVAVAVGTQRNLGGRPKKKTAANAAWPSTAEALTPSASGPGPPLSTGLAGLDTTSSAGPALTGTRIAPSRSTASPASPRTTTTTTTTTATPTTAKMAAAMHVSSSSSSIRSTSTISTSPSATTWHSSPSTRSTSSRSTVATSESAASSPSLSYSSSPLASPSSRASASARPSLAASPVLPLVAVVPPPGEDVRPPGDGLAKGYNHRLLTREARRPVMQRVSAFLPSWDKRNSGQRTGLFAWSNRSSTNGSLAKLNTQAANGRVHREAFWPAPLDRECDKAARILKSFSTDGYLAPLDDDDQQRPPSQPQSRPSSSATSEPKTPAQITKKIPRRIIQNAAGIAIFTCMRSGLWMTGSGGSGILIARKSDGTWSPPSGIMLHTPTLSFIIGVDIYDCVLVINNLAALESITKPRVTLGEDVGLMSGPLVTLDSDEAHIRWKDLGNTVLTYMKARGQSQLVNLNGCILAERTNENERFYASTLTQMDILAGNVARHVDETKPLFEVIKMAEGRTDYEAAVIEKMAVDPAPGDAMIATPKSSTPASPRAFGVPNPEDPDPFGVLALEMAGLEIREAGSRLRPASSQFDFNPAPTSPAFSKFNRQSIDTYASRSNRGSYMSSRTVKSTMTDAGTQTDVGKETPETTPSPGQSEDGNERASSTQIPEVTEEEEEVDYTKVDLTPLRHLSGSHNPASVTSHSSTTAKEQQDRLKVDQASSTRDDADKASSHYENENETETENGVEDLEDDIEKTSSRDADDEDDLEDDEDDEEEPVVFEVAAVQTTRPQAVASRMIHAKGNVVTIPKRIPPPLPMRSPARTSRSSKSEIGDVSNLKSPLRQAFSEADLRDEAEENDAKRQSSQSSQSTHLKPPVESFEERFQDAKADAEKSSDSEPEFFPADETKDGDEIKAQDEVETDDTKVEHPSIETQEEPQVLSQSSSEQSLATPREHPDNSDAISKKHSSSIYTGATEDRWSFDGSSLTTPTSDRPFYVVDDIVDDDTPRKLLREAEKTEKNEQNEELEKVQSRETTPTAVTVA